jgi:hypothetical protein
VLSARGDRPLQSRNARRCKPISAKSYLYYYVLGAAPSFRPNAFVPAIHNMTLDPAYSSFIVFL